MQQRPKYEEVKIAKKNKKIYAYHIKAHSEHVEMRVITNNKKRVNT